MRLAYGQIRSVDKEILTNARQMGIDRVQFNLPHDLPADGLWKYEDLARFREACDRYGVIVEEQPHRSEIPATVKASWLPSSGHP